MTVRVAFAVLLASIALVATSCQGELAPSPSPVERYVEAYCATTLRYGEELKGVFDDLRLGDSVRRGSAAIPGLLATIERGVILARNYREELAALPMPSTEAGRRAANYADNFARHAIESLLHAKQLVRKLPDSPSPEQSESDLSAVASSLTFAYTSMTGAELAFRKELPAFGTHFDTAESCKKLDALDQA